jgi:hypothetical protein
MPIFVENQYFCSTKSINIFDARADKKAKSVNFSI